MAEKEKLDRRGLAHLSIVYLVWGSTYLAIRVAVRDGAGFPPFTMALMRVIAASAVLLGWAYLRGERIRLTRGELGLLAGSGVMLWVGGNGLVTWAEIRVSSGLAALLVAAMPIWGECIGCILDRRLPGWRISVSIALGFAGVAVLSWPVLSRGTSADVLSVFALLLAPLSWAAGSIWLQRRRLGLGDRAMSGWQQLLGGAGLLVFVLLRREPLPAPTGEAWMAWGYLVVMSSVICFTSYLTTLRLLPYQVVMTYAYVNPVIAVFLGWLILREDVTWYTLTGAALVVAGVVGIFRNRR
ncbi:MAG TPA: EamA family transporter [Candidatus Eisenbacteria bacterium]|uniref:EamA family transporter n=1 Tax=Eiseniibacteriota bacterium TaxID=2212470 RepID=A0A7V2AV33_UNCEI|nr:EamA family transporter [Candidatus Eisenbacteria bacterium]